MSNYQLTHSASDIDAAITKQVNSVSDLSTAAGSTNFPTSSSVDNYIDAQLPAIQATIDSKVAQLSNAVMNNNRSFNNTAHSLMPNEQTPGQVINENTTGVPLFVTYVVGCEAYMIDGVLDISNNNFASYLRIFHAKMDADHSNTGQNHYITLRGVIPPGYKWKAYVNGGFTSSSGTFKDLSSFHWRRYLGYYGHTSFKLQ